jgi:hypothetical protein
MDRETVNHWVPELLAGTGLTPEAVFETMTPKKRLAKPRYSGAPPGTSESGAPMTIHFAAARNSKFISSPHIAARAAFSMAANDNALDDGGELLINVALRYFAEHGLSAARQARDEAKAAFFAGDREAYDRWMSICRALDKCVARQLAREVIYASRGGNWQV